jgi:hypothetical protein
MSLSKITLDGTVRSNLDWSEQKKKATEAETILWHLDLGLFSKLSQPISSVSQYHSLKMSLDHFCNTLWIEFKDKTQGVCLYEGSADFSRDFPWDPEQEHNLQVWLERGFGDIGIFYEEIGVRLEKFSDLKHEDLKGVSITSLFCRDVAGEFLDLLAGYLPENLEASVILNTSGIDDPLLIAQLTTKERYPHLKMFVDGKPESVASVGICLPAMDHIIPSFYAKFSQIFRELDDKPYRLIPEALLTSEWHGLDILYVSTETVSPQGKRKLLGFEATGGIVIYI